MKIIAFDNVAWLLIRLVGLIMANVSDFALRHTGKRDIEDWANLLGLSVTGWMLFSAKSPNDVPDIIGQKCLMIGRFLLAFMALSFVIKVAVLVGGR